MEKLNRENKTITIDSVKGGYGDVWMRLLAFYTLSELNPEFRFRIKIQATLENLAIYTFGDRMTFSSDPAEKMQYAYTSIGIRHLLSGIIKGQKYIAPYQKAVIHDKKHRQFKDTINTVLFGMLNWCGLVAVPSGAHIEKYQGFLEIAGIRVFRRTDYRMFCEQLKTDHRRIIEKLRQFAGRSAQLQVPAGLDKKVLVFPTGTGRQFVPVWWAKKYMNTAVYAFFYRDRDQELFLAEGLETVSYYTPDDIVALSKQAGWTICTDSFPSHLLQHLTSNCTILITGTLKSRIVSPAFGGKVVDAAAPCHPCLHLDRGNHPLCAAGYKECLNWQIESYTQNVVDSYQ